MQTAKIFTNGKSQAGPSEANGSFLAFLYQTCPVVLAIVAPPLVQEIDYLKLS